MSRGAHRAPPRGAVVVSSWLRGQFLRLADAVMPAHLSLLEHAHAFGQAYILAAMVELGVPDALSGGALTADELAVLLDCRSDPLHRLLRAAAVFRAVELTKDGRFRATRFTRLLRDDHPSGAAGWCRYIASTANQAAWGQLAPSVRTGDGAFARANGMSMFAWLDQHPIEGANFSAGIGGLTLAEAPAILSAYGFPDTGVVCDLGGGQGVLLAQILRSRPGLTGVLVDSEPVLAQADAYLTAEGLRDRVTLSPGDLFGELRVRADVYLLKWILHDWDDRAGHQILTAAAATMPEGATLVLLEGDQPWAKVDARFSMIDLQMFVVTDGGRERSVVQLQDLLRAAGLVPGRCRRASTGLVLVEAGRPPAGSTTGQYQRRDAS